jgi:hypothetical protein
MNFWPTDRVTKEAINAAPEFEGEDDAQCAAAYAKRTDSRGDFVYAANGGLVAVAQDDGRLRYFAIDTEIMTVYRATEMVFEGKKLVRK